MGAARDVLPSAATTVINATAHLLDLLERCFAGEDDEVLLVSSTNHESLKAHIINSAGSAVLPPYSSVRHSGRVDELTQVHQVVLVSELNEPLLGLRVDPFRSCSPEGSACGDGDESGHVAGCMLGDVLSIGVEVEQSVMITVPASNA